MSNMRGFFAFFGSFMLFILAGATVYTELVHLLPSINTSYISALVLACSFVGWQLVRMKFLDAWIRRQN